MYDSALKYVVTSERRSDQARYVINANIDAQKLCVAALRNPKKVRQITVLAPVRPRFDRSINATREHPLLWESGGRRDAKTASCIIPAGEDAGIVPYENVFQIRPLSDRPSGWHGAAIIARGMHFAVGYSDDADDIVLVYKIDSMCEHLLESKNNPNRKESFAALDCSLVGYLTRTWKGDQGVMPEHCKGLVAKTFAKLAAPSYTATNLEAFRLNKKTEARQKAYELPDDIGVETNLVDADQFLPTLFQTITEFRNDLKDSGSEMAERPVRLRAVYDVTDEGEIDLTVILVDPITVSGEIGFDEGGSVSPGEPQKLYQAVAAVFDDISILKEIGSAFVIRRN